MPTYYASTTGSDLNAGTLGSPWSLAWAMNSANTVLQPGDTVRLLPGVYQFPATSTPFLATKAGTATAPIMYRPHIETERTAIGGGMQLRGANVVLYRLECVFDSQETRDGGADQTLLQRWNAGVDPQAANIRFIECNMHDQLQGMFAGTLAPGLEVTDSLIWNNGVDGPSRGHGHSLYIQGAQAAVGKVFRNLISWGGYKYGMQYYGTEDSVVYNTLTEDSSFFMMGASSKYGEDRALVTWQQPPGVGGNLVWRRCNMFVKDPSPDQRVARIGAFPLWNASGLVFEDNVFRGSVELARVNDFVFQRNLVWVEDGAQTAVYNPLTYEMQDGQPTSAYSIDNNQYFKRTSGVPFNLTNWRNATGWDLNSTAANANPTGVRVNAVPARYSTGRGHLHVWNFSGASSVVVDIGPALQYLSGFPYAVYHVFDFVTGGQPIAQGTYSIGTTVTLPMDTRTPPRPYGAVADPPTMPNTFGAFVVTQRPGWTVTLRRGI